MLTREELNEVISFSIKGHIREAYSQADAAMLQAEQQCKEYAEENKTAEAMEAATAVLMLRGRRDGMAELFKTIFSDDITAPV